MTKNLYILGTKIQITVLSSSSYSVFFISFWCVTHMREPLIQKGWITAKDKREAEKMNISRKCLVVFFFSVINPASHINIYNISNAVPQGFLQVLSEPISAEQQTSPEAAGSLLCEWRCGHSLISEVFCFH